jgi:hypothetical protein
LNWDDLLALLRQRRFLSVKYECLWSRLSERLAQGPAAEGTRFEFF